MVDVVEAVASRIESLSLSRPAYRWSAPSDPGARYFIVRASTGQTYGDNLSGGVDSREPVVWITSVSSAIDPASAGREAAWGAQRAVDALMGWRFTLGQATWLPEHVASQPPTADDSLPDRTVTQAVEQFVIKYQP